MVEKLPIGYACKTEWKTNPCIGYVELHPTITAIKPTTVQVIVDQNEKTIHINGSFKSVSVDASNAITLHF